MNPPIFSYICNTYCGIPSPNFRGGDFCVLNQLVTMKITHFTYTAPTVHKIALRAERGFGASLEIPTVDPEQGWSLRPTDEIIEE